MNSVVLVVLAHYEDVLAPFYETAEKYEPSLAKILVDDSSEGLAHIVPAPHWMIVIGEKPFIYSRNVNIGWRAAADSDVILCGDDVRFTMPFVQRLQEVAYSDPTIGISCPETGGQSPFVCGYFKREALDKVGPMDEDFKYYGYDDNLWTHKMGKAGYRTQPTTDIKIIHQPATTYYRREHEGGMSVQHGCDINRALFEQKIGQSPVQGEDRWLKEGRE